MKSNKIALISGSAGGLGEKAAALFHQQDYG